MTRSPDPLTVMHVITRLILGGAQENTVLTCAGQAAGGHRVWLAHGPVYGPEGSLLAEARASGATVVQVPSLRRAVLPMHDAMAWRALIRLIRRVRPDVVHTHSSKAGILGRAAAWAERVPVVIHTVHGLPFHARQSAAAHRAYVLAERWAARRCHRMIGITAAMRDAFLAQHIGQPQQFAVIPSGVDVAQFSPPADARLTTRRELGIAPDVPVIGIVARFDPLKGHDDLIDALAELAKRHDNLRAVFVGDGWSRAVVEQRVRQAGLADRVVMTGLVPVSRVAALLSAMDVMALPSYQEGQGRTLVEALLCGCAIVAYDVGGVGEVCIDGTSGRLVPLGDRAALATALAWMLEHGDQRRQLTQRGRRLALERFDHRRMIADIEDVYRQVL